LADRLRDCGDGGVEAESAGAPAVVGDAAAAAASACVGGCGGGGEESSDGPLRLAAELRLVSTIARERGRAGVLPLGPRIGDAKEVG
jgi:hypothetical protein